MEEEYGSGVGSYLELIGTYFSFIEIIAVGLMFWVSSGAKGSMLLIFFNMAATPSELAPSSPSWFMKSYEFVKGWAFSILVIFGISIAS